MKNYVKPKIYICVCVYVYMCICIKYRFIYIYTNVYIFHQYKVNLIYNDMYVDLCIIMPIIVQSFEKVVQKMSSEYLIHFNNVIL